jgi:pimeloyl-ACP methyl ester carboxylesterase
MIGFGSDSQFLPTQKGELSYKKAHEMLTSQRMSKVIRLASGEQITIAEAGDRKGIPCFWIGGPCSNRFIVAIYHEMCTELGIRLIAFDRPGRGGSSPLRNPKEWKFGSYASIECFNEGYLDQVSDHLKLEKFFIVAHSFGSSYAYAGYDKLKHKILGSLRVLATWAPSNLPTMPSSYAIQRSIPTRVFRAINSFASNPTVASLNYQLVPMQMGSIGAREQIVVHDPYVREILDRMNNEHLGDGFPAYELDWLLALEIKHKFDYNHRKLKCSIKCWHGMDDTIAPLGAAMWMQRETDHFLLYAVEGASHNIHLDFAIVKAVFADICAENMSLEVEKLSSETAVQPKDDLAETAEISLKNSSSESVNSNNVTNDDSLGPSEEGSVVHETLVNVPGLETNVWK